MSIKLASLFIELGVNGDKLTAELSRTSKKTKSWARAIDKSATFAATSFAGVTLAATATAAGIKALFDAEAPLIRTQKVLADRLGTTVGELRVLSEAGKTVDVDLDGVNDTLSDFIERLGEAKTDGGEPAEALKALGLQAAVLARQDPAVSLRQVLEAFNDIPDAGVRASTAAKLFGDAGIKLTTNSKALTEAIDRAREKITALGGSLTSLEAQKVVDATNAMDNLRLASDLVREKITARLAPAVTIFAESLFESIKQAVNLDTVMDRVATTALDGLASVSRGFGSILGFIEGQPEILKYGALGYFVLGRKGLAIGAVAGLFSDRVEAEMSRLAAYFDDTTTEAEARVLRLESLRASLELRDKLPLPGFLEKLGSFSGEDTASLKREFAALLAEVRADQGINIPIELQGLDQVEQEATEAFDQIRSTGESVVNETQRALNSALKAAREASEAATSIPSDIDYTAPLDTIIRGLEDSVSLVGSLSAGAYAAADGFDLARERIGDIIKGGDEFLPPVDLSNSDNAANDDTFIKPAGVGAVEDTVDDEQLSVWQRQADAYTAFQDRRIADNLRVHDAEVARLESDAALHDNYFADRISEADQFESTWTLFQKSGSADRLSILKNEMAGALGTLAQHSKTFFKINKLAGLANAAVSIGVGITKALELPFPANLAAAAKVALTGAAQIVSIQKAKFGAASVASPGAAGGSISSVPTDVSSVNTGLAANDSRRSDASDAQAPVTFNEYHPAGTPQDQRYDDFLTDLARARDSKDVSINDDAEIEVNYLDLAV